MFAFQHVVTASRLNWHYAEKSLLRADEIYPFVTWLITHPTDTEVASILRDHRYLTWLANASAGVNLFFFPVQLPEGENPLRTRVRDLENQLPAGFDHFLYPAGQIRGLNEGQELHLPALAEAMQGKFAELPGAVVVGSYDEPPIWARLASQADAQTGRVSLEQLIDAMRDACKQVLPQAADRYLTAGKMTAYRRFREHPEEKRALLRQLKESLEELSMESDSAFLEPTISAQDVIAAIGLIQTACVGS